MPKKPKPTKPKSPARAEAARKNGTKGGRPRELPSPDALLESARILRDACPDGYGGKLGSIYLEPVALLLERLAGGHRIPQALTAPVRSPEVLAFLARAEFHRIATAPIPLDGNPQY